MANIIKRIRDRLARYILHQTRKSDPPQNHIQNLVFDMEDRCNLTCPSCYHGIHGGTKNKMSLETCKIILDHCETYFKPQAIHPFNWGEPFLCKNLGDFILLFSKYPRMKLWLSSNMNKTLPTHLIEIILQHTDTLMFSVSGLDQEVYRQYHRGGNIGNVMANIEAFIAVRNRIGSKTSVYWRFGGNRHNASQAEKIRKYCEANRIAFVAARYYVTDAQDVDRILKGEEVDKHIYDNFYESVDEVRQDIVNKLTPAFCCLLTNDIVVDCEGYLMTCSATKISLGTHITEITTKGELIKTRLGDKFCGSCFQQGLVGYFQISRG